jgi:hypothetical protein
MGNSVFFCNGPLSTLKMFDDPQLINWRINSEVTPVSPAPRFFFSHNSVQKLLSSLLCRDINITIWEIIILPVVLYGRPPLWSSRQSTWLQIQMSRVRFPALWEVVVQERGPLSLVNITEELLEWKSSGFGSKKSRLTLVGIRFAVHATFCIFKSWH